MSPFASAGQVDEIAQSRAELDLVNAGPDDVAREAEEPRPARIGRTDGREGVAPFEDDAIDVDQGLDVVDDGRPVEETRLHRERRLLPRFASKALDRVEQSRLLAAYVGTLPAADLDIEREVRSEDAVAEQTGRPGGFDRSGHPGDGAGDTHRGCTGTRGSAPTA